MIRTGIRNRSPFFWPAPPELPEFNLTPEEVALEREKIEEYEARKPPCEILTVTFEKLRILKQSIPAFPVLHALGDWQQHLFVAQENSQPDKIVSIDLKDHIQGTTLPLPVEVDLCYSEDVRVERAQIRPPGLPVILPFAVATGGWINPDETFADELPSTANGHGGDEPWSAGQNTLSGRNRHYAYEVIYRVDCAPVQISRVPFNDLIRIILPEIKDGDTNAFSLDATNMVIAKHGYLVQHWEEAGNGSDRLLTIDGPGSIQQLFEALKKKRECD